MLGRLRIDIELECFDNSEASAYMNLEIEANNEVYTSPKDKTMPSVTNICSTIMSTLKVIYFGRLAIVSSETIKICEGRLYGKMSHKSLSQSYTSTMFCAKYFITFIENTTRFTIVSFLKHNGQAFSSFSAFKRDEAGRPLKEKASKCLRQSTHGNDCYGEVSER